MTLWWNVNLSWQKVVAVKIYDNRPAYMFTLNGMEEGFFRDVDFIGRQSATIPPEAE